MFDSRNDKGDHFAHPEAPMCEVATYLTREQLELKLRGWGLNCKIDIEPGFDMFTMICALDHFRVTVNAVNLPVTQLMSYSDYIKRYQLITGGQNVIIE